jgi:hypothetical protein
MGFRKTGAFRRAGDVGVLTCQLRDQDMGHEDHRPALNASVRPGICTRAAHSRSSAADAPHLGDSA